jgi:tetratricopeptide (TPR) repeat protein
MKKTYSKSSIVFFILFFAVEGFAVAASTKTTESLLVKYYSLLNEGDQLALNGKKQEALDCYKKALRMAKNDDTEVVARGSLLRFYEKNGDYYLAMEETDWFLRRNLTLPGRMKYEETKQRLLKKIEAQKRGEKIEERKSEGDGGEQQINRASDFHKADYRSQGKFLEKALPEDTGIRRLGKQAMLAEHAGKFGEAKESYEKMLVRKEEAVAAFGESGWVMLHPAVQRTAEVTGDEVREKEMLVWIRDNILVDQGPYHQYLGGLLPQVQEHLKERLEELGLERGV